MSSPSPIQNSPKPQDYGDTIPVEIEGLSEEERLAITRQIDDAAKSSTMGSMGRLTPEKKGAVFPLVVNILAVLLISAGIYLSNFYFNQRVEELTTEKNQLESAEGKILEEVKKESEKKLKAKEAEISKIRDDLTKIEQERQSLQENIEQQIAGKEEELKQQFQMALEQERARLESEGISQGELESRLESFQSQQRQEYQAALEEYKEESLKQLQEKERELVEAKATAEKILNEANKERQQLLEDAQQREEELRRQFQRETEKLARESSEAQEELSQLEEVRKKEELYREQINNLYLAIESAIENNNPATARENIEELRTLVRSPALSMIAGFNRRRQVDSFLLDVLDEHAAGIAGGREDESLLESARIISTLRSTVEEAEALQSEGNLYDARRFYNRAIEMIPAVETAVTEIEQINLNEAASRIEELITKAGESLEEDNEEDALELYSSAAVEAAVDHREFSRVAIDGILEISARKQEDLEAQYEEEKAGFRRRITELREQREALQSEMQGMRTEIENLKDSYSALQNESANEQEALRGNLQSKEEEMSTLRERIRAREEQIAKLNSELETLEKEQLRLSRNYADARTEITELNSDLEGAVDQIAELVTQGESNRRLRSAIGRYEELVQQSKSLLSSSGQSGVETTRAVFENFLESQEVREIFPQLLELYQQIEPDM